MIILALYFAFLIIPAVLRYRKSGMDMDRFAVGGRNASGLPVAVSIAASCVGGSATIGVVSLAWSRGFPSVWYLLSGAAGLLVLTVFLARKVRETGLRTLPEIIRKYIGAESREIAAVIITVAWTAILAAQFKAAGGIISAMTGMNAQAALVTGAAGIVLYTALGGQLSVMKSDVWQFLLIAAALAAVLVTMAIREPRAFSGIEVELFNSEFGFDTWSYYMVIIGGGYVVCPMLFSRLLSAKSSRTAFRASLTAVVLLVITAVAITLVGLTAKNVLPAETDAETILTAALPARLPAPLNILLWTALLSAVISSADSCLITASTVFCNDLLKTSSVGLCRVLTVVLGAGALILGQVGRGILPLLFAANDVFVSGIVGPVFIAMVFSRKHSIHARIAMGAMAVGGILGLAAALLDMKSLSMAGVGVSVVLTLTALRRRAD